ncbi:hypothetical protein ANRL4_00145 [Anaerolineae bacterium]|nr:hypothetical protein ANRL4_00145 [Anaerolineae bacterium]
MIMTDQRIFSKFFALFLLLFIALTAFTPTSASAQETYLNNQFLKAKIKASLKFGPNDFETLLVDFMVNGNFDAKAVDRSSNPQALYLYRANDKIVSYIRSNDKKHLKEALESIGKALHYDTDNALLYFMKSYVEHSLGQSAKAYETFKEGCGNKSFSAYQESITKGLVTFLKTNDSFNAYNCFFIHVYWPKITLEKDLVVYVVKTARGYYKDRTVQLASKQQLYNSMCSYMNRREQSLDLLRSSLFLIAENLVRKAPAEIGVNQCPVKYAASVKNAAKEAMQAAENYHKTKNLKFLNESSFWKNFKELSR